MTAHEHLIKNGIISKHSIPSDPVMLNVGELIDLMEGYAASKQLRIKEDGLIDIEYLRSWHPELNDEELESLLKFSQENSISYQECYGDGSIIYPLWEKWRAEPQ